MTVSFPAAVLRHAGAPLSIEQARLPNRPPAGEVLVELAAAGLCASDRRVMDGDWSAPTPLVLGHEGAGVVRATGPGVNELAEGDHVVLCWTPPCGRCRFCLTGRPTLCDRARGNRHTMPDGGTRLSVDGQPVYSYLTLGTFGQFAIVQEAAAIPVRRDVPLHLASIVGCAVTTGIGAVINTARVQPGASVLVLGCGGVGLSVIQGAALVHASPVVAVDRNPQNLRLARQLGATHAILNDNHDLSETVGDLTDGHGFDYTFEAAGQGATAQAAIDALGRGGTAVLVGQGGAGSTARIDPAAISDEEKTIRGCNYGSARPAIDFARILDLHAHGAINLGKMITRRIRLEDINQGLQTAATRGGARTIIDYHLT